MVAGARRPKSWISKVENVRIGCHKNHVELRIQFSSDMKDPSVRQWGRGYDGRGIDCRCPLQTLRTSNPDLLIRVFFCER
jgi:hypothetical protein